MKLTFFILFLVTTGCSIAQVKVSRADTSTLPKGMIYTGRITNSAKWLDKFGTHYVLTTETGEYLSIDTDKNQVKNAAVFAYHYLLRNDSLQLEWKIYDFNKDCAFDVSATFISGAFSVTDLDNNGIAEVWVMYENQCTSDVSPAPTKIIMYEGKKKYAIRGQNRVRVSANEFVGGEYTLDENFKTANTSFKQFGIRLWEKNNQAK